MVKTLIIEGMMCKNCVKHVEAALSAIPGADKVRVDLKRGQAQVKCATDIPDSTFKAAITDAGYELKEVA